MDMEFEMEKCIVSMRTTSSENIHTCYKLKPTKWR